MSQGSVSSAWQMNVVYSMRLLCLVRMRSSTRVRHVTSALVGKQLFHPRDEQIPPVQARIEPPGLSDEADEQAEGSHASRLTASATTCPRVMRA